MHVEHEVYMFFGEEGGCFKNRNLLQPKAKPAGTQTVLPTLRILGDF